MGSGKEILKEFASRSESYFTLLDGEEKTVKFAGVDQTPNKFDGGKTLILRYYFEENGQMKKWDRASKDLARQMLAFEEGDVIFIKRTGQNSKTKYSVRRVE